MARKKRSKLLSLLLGLVLLGGGAYFLYQKFIVAKIHLRNKNYTYIYVGREDQFEDVVQDVNAENIIDNIETFEWLAKKMSLNENIHPGRYRLTNGMTMRQIINLLKYDKQERVKLN